MSTSLSMKYMTFTLFEKDKTQLKRFIQYTEDGPHYLYIPFLKFHLPDNGKTYPVTLCSMSSFTMIVAARTLCAVVRCILKDPVKAVY